MKQQSFERRHQDAWSRLEQMLGLDGQSPVDSTDQERRAFPRAYRQLCQQLAVAELRGYGAQLVTRLNRIALAAHHRLYGATHRRLGDALRFLLEDFPRCVRRHRRYVLVASLLFYAPAVLLWVATQFEPSLSYSVLSPANIQQLESMYNPALDKVGEGRDSSSATLMFGYYILNNISIALRTIAGGLLFGLGTIFFVSFNGIFLGAAAGHLSAIDYGSTFWPFVIGHGAFELTAIVLAGAVGLRLGVALWVPGRRTRRGALRRAAQQLVPLIGGTVAFLVVAAMLEAYWSSIGWTGASVKLGAGVALWLLVTLFLVLAGRGRAA